MSQGGQKFELGQSVASPGEEGDDEEWTVNGESFNLEIKDASHRGQGVNLRSYLDYETKNQFNWYHGDIVKTEDGGA